MSIFHLIFSMIHTIVFILWGAFALVWGSGMLAALIHPRVTVERDASYGADGVVFVLFTLAGLMIVGAALAFDWRAGIPGPFAPFGVALVAIGVGVAVWARVTMGALWSLMPRVTAGHRVVREGPFAMVRHPIYAGLIVAELGTVLALTLPWVVLLSIPLSVALLVFKAKQEEQLLLKNLGEEYALYQREVPLLAPRVTRGRRGSREKRGDEG